MLFLSSIKRVLGRFGSKMKFINVRVLDGFWDDFGLRLMLRVEWCWGKRSIIVVWSFPSSFQVVSGVRSCFVRFGLDLVRTRQAIVQQQEPLRRSGALTPSLRRSDYFRTKMFYAPLRRSGGGSVPLRGSGILLRFFDVF